ncbi:MAG TPA: putative lipid II flippase FtsW [Firmicutes bacterium]|nr:putative lipid II flippase FtsW [Bacillota bacterium]
MKKQGPDLLLLLTTIFLLVIGVILVTSASAPRALSQTGGKDPFFYGKRQAVYALLGFLLLLATLRVDYRRLRRFTGLFAFLAPLFLLVVLFVGEEIQGARRWVNLGLFTFQPSEFAKLSLVFVLAHYLAELGSGIRNLVTGILLPLVYTGIIGLLIILEPDLGTMVVVFGIFFIMLFAAGARLFHLFLVGLFGAGAGVGLILKEPYRLRRLFSFLDPASDPTGDGWQINQGLMALGSGGLFGVGLGRSRQKFFYLPESHADYIFAIIGEELGLIGTIFLLFLFFIVAWRGYKIALTAPDRYGSLLAVGITSCIVIQALINIAVVTATIPTTGITLPLISAGGSSLWITLISIGILLNISKETGGSG